MIRLGRKVLMPHKDQLGHRVLALHMDQLSLMLRRDLKHHTGQLNRTHRLRRKAQPLRKDQ